MKKAPLLAGTVVLVAACGRNTRPAAGPLTAAPRACSELTDTAGI